MHYGTVWQAILSAQMTALTGSSQRLRAKIIMHLLSTPCGISSSTRCSILAYINDRWLATRQQWENVLYETCSSSSPPPKDSFLGDELTWSNFKRGLSNKNCECGYGILCELNTSVACVFGYGLCKSWFYYRLVLITTLCNLYMRRNWDQTFANSDRCNIDFLADSEGQ